MAAGQVEKTTTAGQLGTTSHVGQSAVRYKPAIRENPTLVRKLEPKSSRKLTHHGARARGAETPTVPIGRPKLNNYLEGGNSLNSEQEKLVPPPNTDLPPKPTNKAADCTALTDAVAEEKTTSPALERGQPRGGSSQQLMSDLVFGEIEATILARPDAALAVNAIFLFVVKQEGTPVKRFGKLYCN